MTTAQRALLEVQAHGIGGRICFWERVQLPNAKEFSWVSVHPLIQMHMMLSIESIASSLSQVPLNIV